MNSAARALSGRIGGAVGASIELTRLAVTIGDHPIVSDISLTIEAGEFVCLLGPSGCGKSTLLNVIAGFVPATAGRALVAGGPVGRPGSDRGVVFQSTEALFPWLTVCENVEYGLRVRGIGKTERREMARRYLDLVGLAHVAHRFPGEMSGGMRQRVQIARVLVNEPPVVLMDEPFGALDAQTREVMQRELERIWRATKATIVFVTHDIWEAILLADRIVTMTVGPAAGTKTIARVPLPRPRDLADPAALAFYREIRDDIAAEVIKAMQGQKDGLEIGVHG